MRQSHSRPSTLHTDSHASSKEDVQSGDMRQWSSTDSSGYSTDGSSRLRVSVTKASSFHGVTVLSRADSSHTSTSNPYMSKTDSLSSGGTSNLSSPVVLAQRSSLVESVGSDMSAMTIGHSGDDYGPQTCGSPFLPYTGEHGEPLAIWVASAIEKIPPGSLIINPQTGKPYMNPDGSVYRWYPPSDKMSPASASSHLSPVEHSKSTQAGSFVPQQATMTPRPPSVAVGALPSVKPALLAASHFTLLPPSAQVVCQPPVPMPTPYRLVGPHGQELPISGLTYQLMAPQTPVTGATVQMIPAAAPVAEIYPSSQHAAYLQPESVVHAATAEPEPVLQLSIDAKPGSAIYDPGYHVIQQSAGDGSVSYPVPSYEMPLPQPSQQQFTHPSSTLSQPAGVSRPYEDVPEYYPPHSTLLVSSLHPTSSRSGSGFWPPVPLIISSGDVRTAGSPPQQLQPPFYQSLPRQRLPSSGTQPQPYIASLPSSSAGAVSQTRAYRTGSPAGSSPSQVPQPPWSARMPPRGCGGSSNMLQVCGLPSGLPCSQLNSYLSDLVRCFSARRFDIVRDSWHASASPHAADSIDGCCVLAVFDSDEAALAALTHHSSPRYRLQPYTS